MHLEDKVCVLCDKSIEHGLAEADEYYYMTSEDGKTIHFFCALDLATGVFFKLQEIHQIGFIDKQQTEQTH